MAILAVLHRVEAVPIRSGAQVNEAGAGVDVQAIGTRFL
jgi:hypothetical protein